MKEADQTQMHDKARVCPCLPVRLSARSRFVFPFSFPFFFWFLANRVEGVPNGIVAVVAPSRHLPRSEPRDMPLVHVHKADLALQAVAQRV